MSATTSDATLSDLTPTRRPSAAFAKICLIGGGSCVAAGAIAAAAMGGYAVARLGDIRDQVEYSFIRYNQVVAKDAAFINPIFKNDTEDMAYDIDEAILEHPNLGANGAKDFSRIEKNLLDRTNINFKNVVSFIFPYRPFKATVPSYDLRGDAEAFTSMVDMDRDRIHDQATDIRLGARPRSNYTWTLTYHYKPKNLVIMSH